MDDEDFEGWKICWRINLLFHAVIVKTQFCILCEKVTAVGNKPMRSTFWRDATRCSSGHGQRWNNESQNNLEPGICAECDQSYVFDTVKGKHICRIDGCRRTLRINTNAVRWKLHPTSSGVVLITKENDELLRAFFAFTSKIGSGPACKHGGKFNLEHDMLFEEPSTALPIQELLLSTLEYLKKAENLLVPHGRSDDLQAPTPKWHCYGSQPTVWAWNFGGNKHKVHEHQSQNRDEEMELTSSRTDHESKNRFNQQLSARFPVSNDYSHVHVLLIYWESCDIPKEEKNFRDEADDLERLFKIDFHYDVSHFAIPSEESQLALEGAIIQFMLKRSPNTLLIIHYGGHGDPDDTAGEHRRQAVWASAGNDGPKVDWFQIQPRLKSTTSDVLLIVDACFGAQAARHQTKTPNRFELLAACPMGCTTHVPGPDSFTTAVIKEMRSLLSHEGHVVVSELNNKLMKSASGLHETAIYCVLQHGSGKSIDLEPILSVPTSLHLDVASSLVLRLSTHSRIDGEDVFDQILTWLKKHAPRVVIDMSVVQVCHETRSMLGFVRQEPTESLPDPLFLRLAPESQQEIMDICNDIMVQFSSSSILSNLQDGHMGTPMIEEISRSIIASLVRKISTLRGLLERNIIASCTNKASIAKALHDKEVQAIGIEDTLRMKDLSLNRSVTEEALSLELDPSSSQSSSEYIQIASEVKDMLDLGRVFVEYKYYQGSDQDTLTLSTSKALIETLAEVLGASKSDDFHSLECKKWLMEPLYKRFALVFTIPQLSTGIPTTLYEATSCRTKNRPSLDERFLIASKIGQAIRKWHLAGWVHQGISSRNIIFWSTNGQVDYTRPYLCGFEYCRPASHISYPRSVDNLTFQVYRHPDRQGAPSISHRKEHDLYSFGVLLLEIGLWQLAADLLNKKNNSPSAVRELLSQNCKVRLGHYMGVKYREAAITCIETKFGVTEDEAVGSRLSKAFDNLVYAQ
ncbi:hypothetical protein VTL71DRAFT_2056 [Oculimacula yallundae]|uniref:Protein kinase domain-containing protein n=1 Tax=Oculimacula yallundae TaxID=86028 RepID=A0ABR4C7S4_9HELO